MHGKEGGRDREREGDEKRESKEEKDGGERETESTRREGERERGHGGHEVSTSYKEHVLQLRLCTSRQPAATQVLQVHERKREREGGEVGGRERGHSCYDVSTSYKERVS